MNSLSQQGYIQQVSIDCVIFGYQSQQLKILIPKINFKGDFWALPSGFVYQDEDIDEAAQRIIRDRTGINDSYLEQFQVAGKASRNSRAFLDRLIELNPEKLNAKEQHRTEYEWFTQRSISIGYYALVDMNRVVAQKNELDEFIAWYDLKSLPPLIMDHGEIVTNAIEDLRKNLDIKRNAFNLLPETFTMREVQELYEVLLETTFARNNFQKRILDLNALERLEKKFTGAANKAPYLYRIQR
jgi:ADP-ribose pyrophosphatase YjhB (NUDIX family)